MASSFPEQTSVLLTWKKPLVSPQIATRRDGGTLHQEETLKNVCAAELKQNTVGCPKPGNVWAVGIPPPCSNALR